MECLVFAANLPGCGRAWVLARIREAGKAARHPLGQGILGTGRRPGRFTYDD